MFLQGFSVALNTPSLSHRTSHACCLTMHRSARCRHARQRHRWKTTNEMKRHNYCNLETYITGGYQDVVSTTNQEQRKNRTGFSTVSCGISPKNTTHHSPTKAPPQPRHSLPSERVRVTWCGNCVLLADIALSLSSRLFSSLPFFPP